MAMTETPPEAEEKSATKPQIKAKRGKVGGIFFGGLALLIILGLGGLGFWAAQNATDEEQSAPSKATSTPGPTLTVSGVASIKAGDLQQVYKIIADPADYQSLFAATSSGLKRSADGGQTWAD